MTYTVTNLGKICEFKYGDSLQEARRSGGNIPVFGSNGIVGWHDKAISSGPTIVIGRKGSIGEIHFSKVACWPIDTTYYVETTKVPSDLTWLYYMLSVMDLPRLNKSAAVPGLNRNDAYEQHIPLPPLAEQQRIADLLSRADRLRRLRRFALEMSEGYLQAVFLEMFGDPVTNPMGWEVVKLGKLIRGFEAGVNFPPVSEGVKVSRWRVLKISAVTWGEFDPKESKPISADTKFRDSIIARKGDLLMSRANTTELVGAVCRIRTEPQGVLLPDKLWRLCFFDEGSKVIPNYILFALRQPELRRIIGVLATGSSGSMKNISMQKAATLPILVPPLEIQERFSRLVERYDRLRAQQREALRQAEHLFQGLLQAAFRGEI